MNLNTTPSEESRRLAAMLQDLSQNLSLAGAKRVPNPNNNSMDSSLGLLNADALKNLSALSDGDVSKENVDPTNISLGMYLQPAAVSDPPALEEDVSVLSQPLSDSDDEEDIPAPPTKGDTEESFQFQTPFPVPPQPNHPDQAEDSPRLDESSFRWDQVAQANTAEQSLPIPEPFTSEPDQACGDFSWQQEPPDPSFCSGKFSARSTSFGGMNQTRDENFSDYSKIPSFQGSYVSQSSTKMEESIFRSGYIAQTSGTQSHIFQGFDPESQAELGAEFGDNEFGSLGKEQLKDFLENEEAECLKQNPFIEEEPCAAESPGNSSVMSGVSDKSIMLRNSNLWCGDTSKVDLENLRREENIVTKLSRCEYFRHNSSRLGSLDESVEEAQRPDLGFFHNIRSPERKPCALLSQSKSSPAISKQSLSGTFRIEAASKHQEEEAAVLDDESPPSSANTTYMASGNSTKTVVSLNSNTDTLKAAELVSRLQTLADQLGSSPGQAGPVSYPDVVEDSICSNTSKLEESIRETLENGTDINISTISKVLSEASISSDPQHFVNVILGCLKNKVLTEESESQSAQTEQTKKISFCEIEPQSIRSINPANTPKTSSTLPRTGRSSTTPTGRLSHTPTTKMTPTESKRAMLRLTPSSSGPVSRVRTGNGSSKPIKPFSSGPSSSRQSYVVPVKPQVSSAPGSARNTPTPPLSKSESFPSSLNKSNTRQRKLSGTRHSSPIKKVQIQSPPRSLVTTPTSDELSKLLDVAETPHVQMAASSHLTTSTPFHQVTNLSYVMLDHLTANTSVSPLVNPDTSLCPVNLDVSTISPALYTSVIKTVKEPRRVLKIEMAPDWTHGSVVPSHHKFVASIPLKHNVTSYCNCVVKITNVWVGSCEVPSEYWDMLVTTSRESLVLLQQGTESLKLEFMMKKEGAFTFNIGLMLDNGVSTSGLVRIQVEDPNIQVLTSDGDKIDFGTLPLDCSDDSVMMLVNCGHSNVPIYLEMKQPNHFFTFDDGSIERNFSLPGITEDSEHGQGVAKEVKVNINTNGLKLTEPRIYKTEMMIILGSNRDGTLLGSVQIMAKVGEAKLILRKGEEILQFGSNDVGVSKNLVLKNVGNIPLYLNCSIKSPDPDQDTFTLTKRKVVVAPNTSSNFPVTLANKPQSSSNIQHSLILETNPNGPIHTILLNIAESKPSQFNATSKPGLSFGLLQKSDSPSNSQTSNSAVEIPKVFPVESDRSLINFFAVPPGKSEQQTVALRNSTSDPILLTLIIRETDSFTFLEGSNANQLMLDPHETKDVVICYCPKKLGKDQGKLVLKPQGKKLGGKSYKASITLNGVAGEADIVLDGAEMEDDVKYNICFNDVLDKKSVVFVNKGSMTGFVKIVTDSSVNNYVDISSTCFLLPPDSRKMINISLFGDCDTVSLQLNILHGPELVRQVMKKARKLPGGARFCENSSLTGFNVLEEFPGESVESLKQEFSGQLTAMDVKQFSKKTRKKTIVLKTPQRIATFDQLSIEETLSETRIDQSIALPLHTTEDKRIQSPPTSDNKDTIKIVPDRINLKSGGECLLRLINLSNTKVHWDMSWPSSRLSLNPGSGILEAGGEAMVCVEAASSGQAWRGQVQVYTDNSVINVDVHLSGDQQSQQRPSQIIVNQKQLEFPETMLGQSRNSSLTISNTSGGLVQWRAVMEPSFFSISQSAGLLNPSQSVSLGVVFKPAASGDHTAVMSLSSLGVRGGQEATVAHPVPVLVNLRGQATTPSTSKPEPVSAAKQKLPMSGKKPGSGTVSLEKDVIQFPVVKVGETSIAKMKIENRSGSDRVVEILPFPAPSPFRTVHSVVEVKNRCFSIIPVQFQPGLAGDHSLGVMASWEGNILMATLQGKAV